MCDTLYRRTEAGFLFGKNSDRSANEPNLTEFHPAVHDDAPLRKATYIEVENVPDRHAVTIVRPAWMFGAEIGTNDAGVVIGNEAVFTRTGDKRTERLTGMDLLRLALERAASARAAAAVITDLLGRYGQGGNCGFDKAFYYDNSFLIAGPDGAYILETNGPDWILVEAGSQANISNALSQDGPFLASSRPGLERFARRRREPVYTFFAKAKARSCEAAARLGTRAFDVVDLIGALASHAPADAGTLYAGGSVGSLCMHQSALGGHTTGSLVHVAREPFATTWITGCSTPCLAIYKPTYFGVVVPPVFTAPEASLSYWLDRELLVRAVYAGLLDVAGYRDEREEIQRAFLEGDARLVAKRADATERESFQRACADREQAFVERRREAIDRVAENPLGLPPAWIRKTVALGHNVFAPTLRERKAVQ